MCSTLQNILKGCNSRTLGGIKNIYFIDTEDIKLNNTTYDKPTDGLNTTNNNTYTPGTYLDNPIVWQGDMTNRFNYGSITATFTINGEGLISSIQLNNNDSAYGFNGTEQFVIPFLQSIYETGNGDDDFFQITTGQRASILSDSVYIHSVMLGDSKVWYEIEFARDSGNFTEDQKIDRTNGNNYYEAMINLTTPSRKGSKSLNINKLIEDQRPLKVIVKDANDIYWFFGERDEVYVSSIGDGSGSKALDGSKYTLTFMIEQPIYAKKLSNDAISKLVF